MMIYWAVLLFAAFTEILWAMTIKGLSEKITLGMVLVSGFLTVLNMALLAFAMRGIPAPMAYAVWTGLGAAGLTIVGYFFMGEAMTPLRVACIGLVIAGVVGLKLTAPSEEAVAGAPAA